MHIRAVVILIFLIGASNVLNVGVAHAAKPVLTVTANSATTTWGDSFPVLTLSYSGFIDSDEDGELDDANYLDTPIIASTSATVESPAGIYVITPDIESGGGGDFNPDAVLTDSVYDIVTIDGTLTILKADQAITDIEPFLSAPFASKNFGDADFELSAVTDSGLDAVFTGAGACSVSGTTVHILSGTLCTITASQAGNENWNPAETVVKTFEVVGSPEAVVAEPAPRRGGGGGGSRVRNTGGRVLGDSTYYFSTDLYIWDEGQDITELQKVLIAEGLYLDVTAPTGFFGRKTQAAVRLYQSQRGVTPTGNVGPLTRAFLNIGRTDISTDPVRQIDIMYELLLKLQARLAK